MLQDMQSKEAVKAWVLPTTIAIYFSDWFYKRTGTKIFCKLSYSEKVYHIAE